VVAKYAIWGLNSPMKNHLLNKIILASSIYLSLLTGALGHADDQVLPDAVNDNFAPAHELSIELIKQETSSWCWMATSMMVLKYKGIETTKQCKMLNEFFNEIMPAAMQSQNPAAGTAVQTPVSMPTLPQQQDRDCCSETNYACHRRTADTNEMLHLLNAKGVGYQHVSRGLTYEEVIKAIHSDSPMIAFLRKQHSGHVVVLGGVNPEKRSVTIIDPMTGKYELTMGELTFGSKLGRWVETVLIDPQFKLEEGPTNPYGRQRRPNCSMFSNPMTSMGMGMFNMMSGMPFMGGAVRRAGSMMASQMLNSPQMAHDMVECAKNNPQMVGTMMKMLESDRGMLRKITSLIYQSPTLAEGLIDLALKYQGIAPFLFTRLDPALYHALTFAMSKSPSLTQKMMHLMDEHAANVIHSNTPFWNIFFYLGHEDIDGDGSEIADERFIQTVFSDIKSVTHFIKIINKRDKGIRSQLLDFMLLGKRPSEFGQNLDHKKQAYHFNYAMIRGLAASIVDVYDHNDMPNSNSDNPANALLGELMLEMVDMNSDADVLQLSAYGKSFIGAVVYAKESGDQDSAAVYELLNAIIPLDIFVDQLPATDETTPLPRDLTKLPLFEQQQVSGPMQPQQPNFGPRYNR
jgi:hypothetical protein